MGAAHTRDALAEFQNGEERLVYARYRDDPARVYFLEDGTVTPEVRALTRESLECMMPECDNRALKAVKRYPNRRDGFSHHKGSGGHSKESLFHQQAKALLVRWVKDRWPDHIAVAEQATDTGARRADVMVTFTDGRQVAFEVQYAPLTPDGWRARHKSYLEHGIAPVWLLGHLPPHLRRARRLAWEPQPSEPEIELGPLLAAMLTEGVPLWWINPIDEQIGTATVEASPRALRADGRTVNLRDDDTIYRIPPQRGDRIATFTVEPLNDATLTADGITTPASRAAQRAAQDLAAVNTARAQRQAELDAHAEARHRKIEEARAAQAKADEDAKAARQRDKDAKRGYAERKRAEQAAAWETSPERSAILGHFGHIPSPIARSLSTDGGVFENHERWHALICQHHIQGKQGTQFTIRDAYVTLRREGIELHKESRRRGAAVADYLRSLETDGLVEVVTTLTSYPLIDHIKVLRDLDDKPVEKAAVPETPATDVLDGASDHDLARLTRAERKALRRAAEAEANRPVPPPPPTPTDVLPDYSSYIGYVEHYAPGVQPILRWHPTVLTWRREHPDSTSIAAMRTSLGDGLDGVTDDDVVAFLAHLR